MILAAVPPVGKGRRLGSGAGCWASGWFLLIAAGGGRGSMLWFVPRKGPVGVEPQESRVVSGLVLLVAMAVGVAVVVWFHIPMPYQVLAPFLAGGAPVLYGWWWRRRNRPPT